MILGGEAMDEMGLSRILTVKGWIPSSELDFCHSHEHLFVASGQPEKISPALRADEFDKTVNELMLYKSVGGRSIIDAQPVGCCRMPEYLFRAACASGVNIIASTGFHKLVFYPKDHWVRKLDSDEAAEIFITELRSGMYINCDASYPVDRIPAKAGVIKTASDSTGIDEEYFRLFRAAAKASRTTGAPILSHTEMGKNGMDQAEFFISQGVSEDSIIICHLDRSLDNVTEILNIAGTGVYLELDTIGRFKYHSDEDEARLIVRLLEAGHEDRLLLGLDTTRERMKSYGGALGLDYIASTFIPLLKTFGIDNRIINKMMMDNPSKAFSIKA